jgi:hypothetical protein
MATKNIAHTISEDLREPRGRWQFGIEEAGSDHPGAIFVDVISHGDGGAASQVRLRLEDANAVLDGNGDPTGAYTYTVNSTHGFTQNQINTVKTVLTAMKRRGLVVDSFDVS